MVKHTGHQVLEPPESLLLRCPGFAVQRLVLALCFETL